MDASKIVKKAAGLAIATAERNQIVGWNQAAQDLLGYDGRHSVVGQARTVANYLDRQSQMT